MTKTKPFFNNNFRFRHLNFCHLNLFRVSIFVFQISCFLLLGRMPLASAQEQDGSLASMLENLNKITGGQSASLFSWPNLIGGFIFGSIGLVAFIYGKKQRSFKPLIVGIILMVYPYFLTNTFWLYAAGVGLCGLLYYWRD